MRIHPVTHLEICLGDGRKWGRHLARGRWRHGLCLQQNYLLGNREKKFTLNSTAKQTTVTARKGSLDRMERNNRFSLFDVSPYQLFSHLPGQNLSFLTEFTHAFPFPGILFSIHSSGRAQLKYYFLVDISSKPLVMEESSSAGLICNYTSGAYHSYLWCFGKCLTISSLG